MGFDKFGRYLSCLMFAVVFFVSGQASALEGKVVGITDGDTLTLLTAGKVQVKVRLAEIDTPESSQPYGEKAKQALSSLAFGKQANIEVQDQDRYGRQVGRVYVGKIDVNAELIRIGAAWVYRKYNKDMGLLRLEDDARAAKRGLWALAEAQRIPPWEWRAAQRGQVKAVSPSAAVTPAGPNMPHSTGQYTCGGKTKCAQMANCAEASFYLQSCGLARLDGDKDGVPCESICR